MRTLVVISAACICVACGTPAPSSGPSGSSSGSVGASSAGSGSATTSAGSTGSSAGSSQGAGSTGASGSGSGSGSSSGSGSTGASGPTFYISPSGSDANPGTELAPWKTFAHALPKLLPGSTLVLEDGTYTGPTTGYLVASCAPGGNAHSGTAAAPVTVRTQHERMALLAGDGTANPVALSHCGYWTLEGLRGEGGDFPAQTGGVEPGSVFAFTFCDHLVLRRLLGAKNNRYLNSHVYSLAYQNNHALIEECEAYSFHRHGFAAFQDLDLTYRRNYANSRRYPDIDGGRPSGVPFTGDEGLSFYESGASLAENNIAENVAQGFTVHGERSSHGDAGFAHGNRYFGNVAIDTISGGFEVDSRCNFDNPCLDTDQVVAHTTYVDDVSLEGGMGFDLRGGVATVIDACTAMDISAAGFEFDLGSENQFLAASETVTNSFAIDAGAHGFAAVTQARSVFDHCGGFANRPGDFSSGIVPTAPLHQDPGLGGCRVYLPAASTLRGAGSDGGHVGADIVHRYQDGVLTAAPLWRPDGGFPCGAVVPGVNDSPDDSCIGVGARLHVGAPDCPLP